MNITVDYKQRQYGLGESVRQYQVTISEVPGLYFENPAKPADNYYQSREVEIMFRGAEPAVGRGYDHWSDSSSAEVLGGRLELSHAAARQLAQAILQFLDKQDAQGRADILKFEVIEKPEPIKGKS